MFYRIRCIAVWRYPERSVVACVAWSTSTIPVNRPLTVSSLRRGKKKNTAIATTARNKQSILIRRNICNFTTKCALNSGVMSSRFNIHILTVEHFDFSFKTSIKFLPEHSTEVDGVPTSSEHGPPYQQVQQQQQQQQQHQQQERNPVPQTFTHTHTPLIYTRLVMLQVPPPTSQNMTCTQASTCHHAQFHICRLPAFETNHCHRTHTDSQRPVSNSFSLKLIA